jgi:hypothetical protein
MTTSDFGVKDVRVVLIDASPAKVLDAVERLESAASVAQAIDSLGLADRVALPPTRLDTAGGHESVYGMAWRIDGGPAETIAPEDLAGFTRPGYVKVVWDMRVEAGGETGTMLSTTLRFVPTDQESRERLGVAWSVVGPASAALSKRVLAAVKESAEEDRWSPPATHVSSRHARRAPRGSHRRRGLGGRSLHHRQASV